jgi:hypothetical protein
MVGILARLGHVLYWLGCIAAFITFLFLGLASAKGAPDVAQTVPAFLLGGTVYGLPVWLVGLACRYVLAGPKRRDHVPG